ncbi:hypothetical protein M8494_18970 [Serratia ureilytica]
MFDEILNAGLHADVCRQRLAGGLTDKPCCTWTRSARPAALAEGGGRCAAVRQGSAFRYPRSGDERRAVVSARHRRSAACWRSDIQARRGRHAVPALRQQRRGLLFGLS